MKYIDQGQGLAARAAEGMLQLLFPLSTYCICCGKPVDASRSYSICDHCIHHIMWGKIHIDLEAESRRLGRPARLDSAVACMKYGLYERRLIFDLKYDGRTYVARAIGHIMADRLAAEGLAAPPDGAAAGRPGMLFQGRPPSSAASGRPSMSFQGRLPSLAASGRPGMSFQGRPPSSAAAGRPSMSFQGRPLSSAAAGRPGAACRTHLLGGPAAISDGADSETCPLPGISMDSVGGFGPAKLSGTTGGGFGTGGKPGTSGGGFEAAGQPGTSGGGFDYIVPVPVHRDKEKARGFNQAEKMARHLGRRIGVPVLPRAIIRNRMTAAQRSLSAEDRYFNLEGAFSLNPKDAVKIRGSRILLLDDVYTTGATAHRCGDVLKEAGAARVDYIALATSNNFAYGFFDDGQC